MPLANLVTYGQQALMLTLALVLPVLAIGAIVGLLMAVLQAATQVQDPTLAHLPRLVAVITAIAVFGPWMGREIAQFAAVVFSGG